ncbi:hypothetical protein AURDEDRAFT_113417 [Auricularia subglabra TFB-10046 SS5]|nr:hypothetical protein AURDEDRAFT_113417 [Auricularia subglabra TFB-10046 SS5]
MTVGRAPALPHYAVAPAVAPHPQVPGQQGVPHPGPAHAPAPTQQGQHTIRVTQCDWRGCGRRFAGGDRRERAKAHWASTHFPLRATADPMAEQFLSDHDVPAPP